MHGAIKVRARHDEPIAEDIFDPPIDILRPARPTGPIVFASPHSGRDYPAAFVATAALDPVTLRASEDAFVDQLFSAAPQLGAPLVAARFPRAYLDANRDPWELDPAMFADPLPSWAKTRTPRVAAGLGSVPKIVADGAEIYRDQLTFRDAEWRVRRLHEPYHRAVERLLSEARVRFGAAVLIDCHSMPSAGGREVPERDRVDVILGDRHGSSCTPAITDFLEERFRELGYRVSRNSPYAGGWSTEKYGRPMRGINAVQIEINRSLYLDEASVEPHEGFATLRRDLSIIVDALIQFGARWCPRA